MKTIEQCMKREVIYISIGNSVRDAIRMCVDHHIGTLPVVDEGGHLKGTLRLEDLIGLGMPDFLQFLDNIEFIHTFGALELHRPESSILKQPISVLMHVPVIVEKSAGLLRASALLKKHQLLDIPVVDDHGYLVGIASHVDIGVALLNDWIEEAEA